MTKQSIGQMSFPLSGSTEDTASPRKDSHLSQTAKKLLKILPFHVGKKNSISGNELTKMLNVELRAITKGISLLKEKGYPVCSSRENGYWWSNNPMEFNEYLSKQEKENANRIRRIKNQRNTPLGQALVVKVD